MTKEQIKELVTEMTQGSEIFPVAVKTGVGGDDIEVIVDSDNGMTIDRCAKLSRQIEEKLYAELGEDADFSLTVMSAGIGQPFTLERQYVNLLTRSAASGREAVVDIVFRDGRKLTATLKGLSGDQIDVTYTEMEAVEGKKRKQPVEKQERIALEDTKSVSEHLSFK